MNDNLYSFAKLGGVECGVFRLRGVGLANCLFPWARCAIASRQFGLKRVASTWPQLCHRQWLRLDRDKRCYIGLIDESHHALTGYPKLAVLATEPRITEVEFLADPQRFESGVVVFSGIDSYFSSMLNDYAFVRSSLVSSTRPEHTDPLRAGLHDSICIHVRYGDFADPDRQQPEIYHVRQRISWFIHVLNECQHHIGRETPALIFSDASDGELGPLLDLPHVRRAFFGNSIADLYAMSTARVLIASGSTLSMWAAYLGRMPVIWPQSQRRQRLHGSEWEYEAELGYDPLPERVASLIRSEHSRSVAVGLGSTGGL
jgi:hypothetical protein